MPAWRPKALTPDRPDEILDPSLRILDLLTCRARVADAEQLRRQAATAVPTCLVRLCHSGWLMSSRICVALPTLDGPLLSPATLFPDFGQLAWQLAKRRRHLQDADATIYWATRRAGRLTGGIGGTLRQPLQIEHDLLVTEAYLQRCHSDESTPRQWLSEDLFRRDHARGVLAKTPDALLLGEHGQWQGAVEIGGAYGAGRLRSLFRAFARCKLPWELW